MLSTMAPKNADQKPATKKPGTRKDASCSMRALMTKRNSPNVNKLSGSVNTFSMNPSVAFTRPMTIAAMKAAPKPDTAMPGRR